MNKERELLIQAIDAYDIASSPCSDRLHHAFEEIRNYLICEPEDAPVAWIRKNGLRFNADIEPDGEEETPLYLRPPAPERKPMTVEDLETLARRCDYENDKMAHWHKTNFEDGFIAGWRQAEKHYGIGGEE